MASMNSICPAACMTTSTSTGSLAGDDKEDPDTKQRGHFGYKVLALSYGGTLQLRGRNGTAGTTQS